MRTDITGSEWWFACLEASKTWPETHEIVPHGDRRRWDWGRTLRTLQESRVHYERIARIAKSLTKDELVELWTNDNETSRLMREILRK